MCKRAKQLCVTKDISIAQLSPPYGVTPKLNQHTHFS